jgi:hypothetical protein
VRIGLNRILITGVTDEMAVRIQITLYNKLIAEAVVETYAEANKLWSAFAVTKYRKGKRFGGAVISDSKHRHWNVPVGGLIE